MCVCVCVLCVCVCTCVCVADGWNACTSSGRVAVDGGIASAGCVARFLAFCPSFKSRVEFVAMLPVDVRLAFCDDERILHDETELVPANTMWRKLLHSGFEACFGPSTQGAGTQTHLKSRFCALLKKRGAVFYFEVARPTYPSGSYHTNAMPLCPYHRPTYPSGSPTMTRSSLCGFNTRGP